MKIVTALYDKDDRGYASMLENMQKSVSRLGYSIYVERLTSDPIARYARKDNYFAPCYFKPHVIRAALNCFQENILWLDSDCLVRENVDEMLDGCDVAITLRRWSPGQSRDLYDGYINAGVMAFRYGREAFSLINAWTGQLALGSRADQDALNMVLLKGSNLEAYGEIFEIAGAKVKVLPCDIYNFFYFDDKPEVVNRAKIYHVKGHLRPQYYDAIAAKVLKGE